MSEKIAVVGDSAMATGFKLAGISNVFVVARGQEFERKLEELMNNDSYGIIIVNELYLGGIDWKLKKRVDTVSHPVVIPVADISGKTEGAEDMNALIKKALGFDVSKK